MYFSAKQDQQTARRWAHQTVGYEGMQPSSNTDEKQTNDSDDDDDAPPKSKEPIQKTIVEREGGLVPLMYSGVKLMSYG